MRRGLPLRPTLVTGVTMLILVTAATVGVSSYLSSRRAVASLWHRAASETGQRVAQRTLRYLDPAVPYLALTQQQAAAGRLDPQAREALLEHFRIAIQSNPSFTWASWGGADGAYLGVFRTAGAVQASWREVQGVDGAGRPLTRWRDFSLQPDGTWKVLKDVPEPYDPRTRPWYREAVAKGGPVWVEPFLFTSHQQPGFIYAAPLVAKGELLGVFAVEYEVSYLSKFLAEQKVSEHGKLYLVSGRGIVVAHPEGLVTEQGPGGALQIAHAVNHPDPMLRVAWRELQKRGGGAHDFATGPYLVMAETFPPESGIDWIAIGVAPQEDYFGEARRQAMVAVVIGLLVMVAAAGLGAALASRVARGMGEIGEEMDRVGRFELTDKRLATGSPWAVREVIAMAEATDRMKSGLRSFARYVPRQLVQDMLESGEEAKLGGHKQELSILFADLAGFTTLSEQMEPDQLVDALSDFFASMSDVIRGNGGTVDKFIGDAIMAFWGAPRPHEDHALFACQAALRMSSRLAALQLEWRRLGRPELSVRIGINTGTVVVGNIGSPERMNYTVMGDAVNLASRLEGLNKSYGTQLLIGESTAAALQGRLVVRPLDWVAVKGRAQAILVYELVGEKGKVAEGRLASIQLHRDGLELYKARRFAEAAVKFGEAEAARGEPDEAARLLAERARRFAQSPPPADWNGSNVMHEK